MASDDHQEGNTLLPTNADTLNQPPHGPRYSLVNNVGDQRPMIFAAQAIDPFGPLRGNLELPMRPTFIKQINQRIASANNQNIINSPVDHSAYKAANFPAESIKIGTWERTSQHAAELVVKCYFKKTKFAWEILENKTKHKIEFSWSDIQAIRARPTTLDIMLKNPPMFFKEINPQPRKHTRWNASTDFTGQQASTVRRHTITYAPNAFENHYLKVRQLDSNVNRLHEQPFPEDANIYFCPSPSPSPSNCTLSFDGGNVCVEEAGPSTQPTLKLPQISHIPPGRPTHYYHEAQPTLCSTYPAPAASFQDITASPLYSPGYRQNSQVAGEIPSYLHATLNSGYNKRLATSYPSNNRRAPMTNFSYTSNLEPVVATYPSNNHAAMADSYFGGHNGHVAMAECPYSVNNTAVATSYPSNTYHTTGANSSYSGYNYHAGDSNLMTAVFPWPHTIGCTNLPSTSSGFTHCPPPLPPSEFFQTEQQFNSTAQESQMIDCNSDADHLLCQAIFDNLAKADSIQEFTVGQSTLDPIGPDHAANTVPVFQSLNDPYLMIPPNNDLEHPAENDGSGYGAAVGPGMEAGGGSLTGGFMPPPGIQNEYLTAAAMHASDGGGGGWGL